MRVIVMFFYHISSKGREWANPLFLSIFNFIFQKHLTKEIFYRNIAIDNLQWELQKQRNSH